MAMRQSLVDRFSLAAVLLAHPPCELTGVLLDYLQAAVSGPAIHHQILELRVVLIQDGTHALSQKSCLIE